jgi:Helicase associated domain (HA2)
MVNQHRQPVDDCPCFEDAIAFVSVVMGKLECSEDILSIVAMLSVKSVFYRPKEKHRQADAKRPNSTNLRGVIFWRFTTGGMLLIFRMHGVMTISFKQGA